MPILTKKTYICNYEGLFTSVGLYIKLFNISIHHKTVAEAVEFVTSSAGTTTFIAFSWCYKSDMGFTDEIFTRTVNTESGL